MTFFQLALRNLLRNKIRSFAVIGVSALAAGFLFSATVILQSVKSSLELGIERLGADIMVVPLQYEERGRKVLLAGEPSSFYMDVKNINTVRSLAGVRQAAPQLFMASAVLECCVAPNVLLIGYDPVSDFTIRPWVRRTVQPPKKYEHLDSVILGGSLSYLSSEDVRYYGKQFWQRAVLYPSGMGLMDNAVFMSMDVARDMITLSRSRTRMPLDIAPNMISSILVKAAPSFDVRKLAADIERSVPDVRAIRMRELVAAERRDIEAALWGVLAAGAAFWGAMLVMMALVFIMTVNERERELGLFRAMGARRMQIAGLIMSEAAILTGVGALVGTSVGWGMLLYFKKQIIASLGNIHFLWPSLPLSGAVAAACLLLMVVSGGIPALFPAWKISRTEPYAAIYRNI